MASWLSAGSILISRCEQKALCHGADSALTAEMFQGWFSGLSMLKLILFQSKINSNAQRQRTMTLLAPSKIKNAIPEAEPFM